MTQQPNASSTRPASNSARTFTIIGAVCAVIALFLFPVIFGPIGAVLGFIGYAQGDRPAGLYVGIGGIVAAIAGFAIAAALLN